MAPLKLKSTSLLILLFVAFCATIIMSCEARKLLPSNINTDNLFTASRKGSIKHTDPGHSPGVGHLGSIKHTDPGHSPGVGHSVPIAQINQDYFRPTTRANSPKSGHSTRNSP
ncbi:hypothetical protein CDL15_Pgr006778 [Punica granatum]|uniref:Precursor of CEP9-like n=1 Tax=Punica granatum TaxID=22663 RepID=A0A218X7H2_PUNGR|nr:hypothetical protein CDL15_Pgr006778 [Punica granatum]PKI50669.1 hypothetical protein CRG98_028981 [Punica granatum]